MDAMRVDGNVLAGMLDELLRGDATTLVVTCGGCSAVFPLAETVVELDDRCGIVLCRECTHTLFTVMQTDDGMAVSFGSLARLRTSDPHAAT